MRTQSRRPPQSPHRSVPKAPRGRTYRSPLWARLTVVLGAVAALLGGLTIVVPRAATAWFFGDVPIIPAIPSENVGKDITGPINVVLLGVDQRNGEEAEDRIRADSIVLAHIPADHSKVYLISIPRDAYVQIPPDPEMGTAGGMDKINSAFAIGAVGKDGHRDASQEGWTRGATQTVRTISGLVPGGLTFQGLAIISFDGFEDVINALGGVHLCVDEDTYSIHYYPDGTRAYPDLDITYGNGQTVGKHYAVNQCYDMQPWEALDYSRQRHIADGDYGRQRHQQQLLKAIMKKVATSGTLTNVGMINRLQKAAGSLLKLDLPGGPIADWVFTLSSIRPADVIMVKINGGHFNSGDINGSAVEYLSEDSLALLKSVQTDTVYDFLASHMDWIAQDA